MKRQYPARERPPEPKRQQLVRGIASLYRPHFLERISRVATTAVGAKFAVVYIVRTMATSATAVAAHHFHQWTPVTLRTGDVRMRAVQRKVGLRVMVKQPVFPGHGIVATRTLVIKITAVRIIVTVAGSAARVGVAECLGFVAIGALLFRVVPQQRKLRQIVIEEYRVLPVDLGVTALALAYQCRLVRLVILMT